VYFLVATALVAVFAALGLVRVASAYSIHSGDNVTLSQNGPINDTVYTAGRTVDINNEVFGDVFCAGQNITVSGTVHGDVLCAGQTVTINGTVDGDVRLAGQTVTLSAKVGGNATIGGQSFVMDSQSVIGGDITTGATDATLNGKIGRDLVIGSGTVNVNNVVGRNIKAQSETMKLLSGARIGGNIELVSKNDITKDPAAIVSGTISHTQPKQDVAKSKHFALFGFGILWFLYWFGAMLLTAMVLVLITPRLFNSVTNRALPAPWKALLVGFVACMIMPIVIILTALSLIGLPLAFMLGLLWLVVLLLSGPVFAYYLGRLVLRRSTKPLLIMLVGSTILIVLYFIPILGILAVLAALWTGTGMLLLEVLRRTPKPAYTLKPSVKKTES
jgi:cytoskeletal protein CcmA (bactofilin family)